MKVCLLGFGAIEVVGSRHEHDIVIDGGVVRRWSRLISELDPHDVRAVLHVTC